MYHRRIEYPQNKIVELESRRAAAGGGGAAASVDGRDRRDPGASTARPWRIDVTVRDGVDRAVCRGGARPGRSRRRWRRPVRRRPPRSALILTDDAELAELNAAHMGKEGPTDVLSFPLLPPEAFPAHPGGAAGAGGARRLRAAARARLHLGDIVVSVERAIEQAEAGRGGQTGDVRWSAADELRLLVTHGTLHVCGWDHAEPDEEAAMRALERRLLAGRPRLKA